MEIPWKIKENRYKLKGKEKKKELVEIFNLELKYMKENYQMQLS